MTTIDSRATIGLRRPRNTPSYANQTTLSFHYNGPKMGRPANHDECRARWRGIQAFHMGPSRGWNDIGYNDGICEHDVILEGRGVDIYNAGNGTTIGNRTSHATQIMIGDGDELLDGHKRAMRFQRERLRPTALYVHKDWTSTGCPGPLVLEYVRGDLQPVDQPPPDPGPTVPEFLGGPYGRDCRYFTCEGAGVAVIQRRLQQLGHQLTADGDFGPITEREVIRHQNAEGIVADGIVGAVTWVHMWT